MKSATNICHHHAGRRVDFGRTGADLLDNAPFIMGDNFILLIIDNGSVWIDWRPADLCRT